MNITSPFAPCLVNGLRIPQVYLIGAAKAGTTYLASLLWQHPQVHVAKPKEPEFFSFDEHFAKGIESYASIYSGAPPDQMLIDGSTGYTRYPEHPHTAERLAAHSPDAKLIYLMRHPVDRAYSHFVHRWSKELHWNEPFTVPFEKHNQTDTMCVNSSDYRLQLQQYLKHYDEDSILCLFSHELKTNQEQVLDRVCRFLGLEYQASFFPPPQGRGNESQAFLESRVRTAVTDRLKSNSIVSTAIKFVPRAARERGYQLLRQSTFAASDAQSFSPPPMQAGTREMLLERFRPSNQWVETFAGVDLSRWNQ
ncbi:sulfotransferase domain-containing protein [Stieleria marina]|uniref:Sulfotransferase domain protein n=1 Tax=Stieleria marina TaxID=1930275 RepID=A0A517NNU0_9BACT|nr:Sulfotransferase domain protein [Planctomycetes bacterium K23_9]